MEITLNGKGEENLAWRKCCFVITALGSGVFESRNTLGQRPSMMGSWAGGAPGVTVMKALSQGRGSALSVGTVAPPYVASPESVPGECSEKWVVGEMMEKQASA